ncbi:unnamed protein product [Parascedosporium putredinis]|uniref:Squalene/phytoene synthase n=1 Tax=Parascedosporium putredinis TaxID=1442378 RepID=A0A9P1HBJ4_9PEZI|nr:unnamed protein product [Parascedosporium putredinis]CAI8002852.1 unnamed protein product [Parascedosporium putredinis]
MHHQSIVRGGLQRLATSQSRSYRRHIATEADLVQAKNYCPERPPGISHPAIRPRPVQDVYDVIRTLNLELVRLPESVSNPIIGQMRTQFWRDSIDKTFAGTPPREPICLLLRKALDDLEARAGPSAQKSLKFWISRLIKTRERHMTNRPYPSMAALEEYAESTYSTLMYATLAALPMRSMHVDHLASHIGKACGITAILRGIPILLAPPPPPPPRPALTPQPRSRDPPPPRCPRRARRERGVHISPRPRGPGFRDAVFTVATRANDHLITAREMLKNLQAGQHAGHDYEHEGELEEHIYDDGGEDDVARDVRRAFGVLLEAVPAQDYLSELEKRDFDPFAVRPGWKLPWRIWRALKKQAL